MLHGAGSYNCPLLIKQFEYFIFFFFEIFYINSLCDDSDFPAYVLQLCLQPTADFFRILRVRQIQHRSNLSVGD